jgi:hypothetical protein
MVSVAPRVDRKRPAINSQVGLGGVVTIVQKVSSTISAGGSRFRDRARQATKEGYQVPITRRTSAVKRTLQTDQRLLDTNRPMSYARFVKTVSFFLPSLPGFAGAGDEGGLIKRST